MQMSPADESAEPKQDACGASPPAQCRKNFQLFTLTNYGSFFGLQPRQHTGFARSRLIGLMAYARQKRSRTLGGQAEPCRKILHSRLGRRRQLDLSY